MQSLIACYLTLSVQVMPIKKVKFLGPNVIYLNHTLNIELFYESIAYGLYGKQLKHPLNKHVVYEVLFVKRH